MKVKDKIAIKVEGTRKLRRRHLRDSEAFKRAGKATQSGMMERFIKAETR